MRDALLALNRETAPWAVRTTMLDEDAELVAEWRITDAHWHGVFAKAGLTETLSIHMRLHGAEHEVRTLHRSRSFEWRACR